MGYFKSVQSLLYQHFTSGTSPTEDCQKVKKPPSNVCKKPDPQQQKMKALQEKFQQKDGKPIFLKMGIRDQILYRSTVLLAMIGAFETFRMVYNMSTQSKPAQQDE